MKKRIVVGAALGVGFYAVGRYLRMQRMGEDPSLSRPLEIVRPEDLNFWAAVAIGGVAGWAWPKIGAI